MGTIIAIGGGFEDKEEFFLAEHILKICGKERPNFLQIPTPGIDEPRTGRMGTFIKYGCRADQLFLSPWNRPSEEEIARKIRWADLIHVPGGNLEYCMDMWRETHADRYLREAYDQGKILFGTSSGSMCWFQEGYDDCGPRNSVKFVEGTGILPYCNGVHFEHEFWHRLRGRRGHLLRRRQVVPADLPGPARGQVLAFRCQGPLPENRPDRSPGDSGAAVRSKNRTRGPLF